MKWIWAVAVGAALMAGCRSSEPTTNPFLRTTVPPPGTGQGVVVTPGEPYAQGITPPVVTTPAVPAAPPAVTTQPVPVSPAPVAPAPMMAPPPVTPQGDRFNPPGGSYLYHQSSNQQGGAGASTAALAANSTAPAATTPVAAAPQAPAATYPVQPAGFTSVASAPAPPVARLQATAGTSRGDPPAAQATIAMPGTASASTLRILGESSSPPAAAPAAVRATAGAPAAATASPGVTSTAATAQSSSSQPAFRVVAGSGTPAGGSTTTGTSGTTTAPASSTITLSTTAGSSNSTARFVVPSAASSPVVQAAFQPAGASTRSDYAHAADYSALSGKLEYSASTKQWKLRYIPIDGQTDSYGGSVVLVGTPALEQFQPGDLVNVQGTLAGETQGFSPRYQLRTIQRQAR